MSGYKGQGSYPGILQIQHMEYVNSHGTSPGILHIRFAPQYTPDGIPIPPAPFGDATMTDSVNGIMTIYNCRLDNVQTERTGSGERWTAYLEDRRWAWRYGVLNGSYNQLDRNSKLIPASIASPTELAVYCLEQMLEVGYDIDMPPGLDSSYRQFFSGALLLPNGINFPRTGTNPPREWYAKNPAQALQELCDLFQRRLVFQAMQDRVIITPIGLGLTLPLGGVSISTQSPTLKQPDSADSVMSQGAPSCWQVRLMLGPVGKDWDGFYYPVDMLSYAPLSAGAVQLTDVEIRIPKTYDDFGSPEGMPAGVVFDLYVSEAGTDAQIDGVLLTYTTEEGDTALDVCLQLESLVAIQLANANPGLAAGVVTADPAEQLTDFSAKFTIRGEIIGRAFTTATIVAGGPGVAIFDIEVQAAEERQVDWSLCTWPDFPNVRATDRLTIDQAKALARESVFRAYQVVAEDVSSQHTFTIHVRPVGGGANPNRFQATFSGSVPDTDNPGIEVGQEVSGFSFTGDPPSQPVFVQQVYWPTIVLSQSVSINVPAGGITLTFTNPTTAINIPGYGFVARRQQLVLLNKQVDQISPQVAPPIGQDELPQTDVIEMTFQSTGTVSQDDVTGAQSVLAAVQAAGAGTTSGQLRDKILLAVTNTMSGPHGAQMAADAAQAAIRLPLNLPQVIMAAQAAVNTLVTQVGTTPLPPTTTMQFPVRLIITIDPPLAGNLHVDRHTFARGDTLQDVVDYITNLFGGNATSSTTAYASAGGVSAASASVNITGVNNAMVFRLEVAAIGATGNFRISSRTAQESQPAQAGIAVIGNVDRQYIQDLYQGISKDMPPRVYGAVSIACLSTSGGRVVYQGYEVNTDERDLVPVDFSIDAVQQTIIFNRYIDIKKDKQTTDVADPAFDRVADFPNLALQIAVNVRNEFTNQLECFTKLVPVPWGPGTTDFPKVEYHEDVQANVTSEYTQPGDLDNEPNELLSYELLADDSNDPEFRSSYYIAGMLAQFQLAGAAAMRYNGILPIECDGAIQQVSWDFGGEGVFTSAGYNCEHHPLVAPYPKRRYLERLAAIEEQAARNQSINGPRLDG